MRNGHNGISSFLGNGVTLPAFQSLDLGQDGFFTGTNCSTTGAVVGTIGGIFLGEKVADFAKKNFKGSLPDWGPLAIKYGIAAALGIWASKKGIL